MAQPDSPRTPLEGVLRSQARNSAAVGRAVGIDRRRMWSLKSGRSPLKLDDAVRLAEVLGVDVNELAAAS